MRTASPNAAGQGAHIFAWRVAGSTEFGTIKSAAPDNRVAKVALVGCTVFLSWLVSHVTFTFRYATNSMLGTLVVPVSTVTWISRKRKRLIIWTFSILRW